MNVDAFCAYFADSLIEQLVADLKPWCRNLHLWGLDEVVPAAAPYTRGTGRLGKFQILNRLLPHAAGADMVLFVDDDVRLGPDFLPAYLSAIQAVRAAVAQPALTEDSYYSHPITLQHRGCWARLTTFVESGPVVSMTREFIELATPFAESNPMGWGIESQWRAIAERCGLRQAIIDCCPVEHCFRPVGARYDKTVVAADMERFWNDHRLDPFEQLVLREYRRLHERRGDYLAAFPPPAEAVAHGKGTDSADDLPLLWAVAALVRPELIVELGTRWGTSTRTLAHAVRPWEGTVVTADPVDARSYLRGVDCQFVHMSGEDLFDCWSRPISFLYIDTDPHSYRQTRRWLDTWVKTWLADGGVAVFHDVVSDAAHVQVAQAVRDWLREQPRSWHWQEFAGTGGLGLLWRLGEHCPFNRAASLRRSPCALAS
jgi:predicted O-methyltransferase YrrM